MSNQPPIRSGPLRLARDCIASVWHLLRMPGTSHRGPLPEADEALRQSANELRRHVVCLAEEIGSRNVQQRPDQLHRAADYIESQFAQAGYEVRRQSYDVSGVTCCNLEVETLGTSRAGEIVVVGAHYDTVPGSPGANDNGTGVAATLALARRFQQVAGGRTLRFVAFVNEEKPYAHTEQMGSWVYARRCRDRAETVAAMLSLETIGYYSDVAGSQSYPPLLGRIYPSEGNFIAMLGNTGSGRLVRQATGAFRRHEAFPCLGGALPDAVSGIHRSDHRSFWQAGYPALMVTDTAPYRYPHYHTPEDTPDKLDFERTARVVRGLEGVVAALVGEGSDDAGRGAIGSLASGG